MKNYDKTLFVIGLLLIVASSGLYFYYMPKIEKASQDSAKVLSGKVKGEGWNNIEVKKFVSPKIEWSEVNPQLDKNGKEWNFQVFTPPQIWRDKNGEFVTESPFEAERERLRKLQKEKKEAEKMKSFLFSYQGTSNEPYALKCVGDVGGKIINLQNKNTGEYLNGKLNEEIYQDKTTASGKIERIYSGITVKSFKKEVVSKPNSSIKETITTVVLFDKKLGRDVTIVSNKETLLKEEIVINLKSTDGTQWNVKKIGDKIEHKGSVYVVKSIDMNKGEVVVEMSTPNDKTQKSQTMRLSAAGTEKIDAAK